MKKLFLLFLLVMSALVVSTSFSTAYGQKSKIYSGDKSAREIKKSRQIYLDQIADYRESITDLQKQNERLLIRTRVSTDQAILARNYQRISGNDSLIALYNKKISFLEDRANEFLAVAAGKDQQVYTDLRGKPMEVANARLLTAYADNMSNGGSIPSATETNNNDNTSLRGIVVNEWYKPVLAKITGPGGFYREFSLPARGGKATFKIPIPGSYTTTFQSSYESRTVTKVVSFNTIYNYDGQDYDYMATLFRGY